MARDRSSRPEAKPLRLFVAVDVPEDVRRVIAEAFAPWRERFPKARWAPQENWHLTLKFLGSTWPRLADWVHEAVAAAASEHAPFPTRIDGLGCFPNARRARVLWAGLADPEGRFPALAASLDAALAREFEPEKRAFTPHLTVARSDPPLTLPEGFAQTPLRTETFTIDRLILYRSHLQRPAPRYEVVGALPLARP